jgi:hypothetical protein
LVSSPIDAPSPASRPTRIFSRILVGPSCEANGQQKNRDWEFEVAPRGCGIAAADSERSSAILTSQSAS